MLAFVIPLKSPQASNSWTKVSQLFERCVKSVCNQTSDKFRVIVVCNERPQIKFSHPHITYIEDDFPVPDPTDGKMGAGVDKFHKTLVGMNYARQFKPSHTMRVDADDCVSKKLAEFVDRSPHSNGWFVDRGYVYQDGSKSIYLKNKNFYAACGTCNIVRYDLNNLPEKVEGDWLAGFHKYHWSHRQIVEKLAQQGTPLQPLPFAGAIYIVNHGDNSPDGDFNRLRPKGSFLRQILAIRPITSSIRNEFGLYNLNFCESKTSI